MCKCAKWDPPKQKLFVTTCEIVIAEGHRRGKCFSAKGWQRIAKLFNRLAGKNWSISLMKSYWFKLRMAHKLLQCIEIKYHSGTERILAPEHWWEAKIKENLKYAKYKNFDYSDIYDTYDKLLGDTGDSMNALSPSKLSQRSFDLGTDNGREDGGDKLSINVEATDSSGSPDCGRYNSSINIFDKHSRGKRRRSHRMENRHRKKYSAHEIFASLEHMVSVGTDFTSIARSHRKGGMSIGECMDELLSSRYVDEGDQLHLFALWFLRDKENRASYYTAKSPFLRFKFVEYCFDRDNKGMKNV